MKTPNFGPYHVRKWFLQIDDTLATETGALADGAPLRRIVIAAALHNPYAGRFEADLSAFIGPSPMLGEEFGRRIVAAAAEHNAAGAGAFALDGRMIDAPIVRQAERVLTRNRATPSRSSPASLAARDASSARAAHE